jgi:hypothetical protein
MSDLSLRIEATGNKLVRIAKVFDRVGEILNVLNRIVVIAIPILTALFMSASGIDPGIVYFLLSIPFAFVVFAINWLYIAIFRAISSYFLLKGLLALKEIEVG